MNITNNTYDRLIRSAMCEEVLSTLNIHLNVHHLKEVIKRKNMAGTMDKKSDLFRYYQFAKNNDSFISTKYYSRDKITFRMFNKKGHLNLITLSDKDILKSVSSRMGGYIVEIDYKAFEYTIMCDLLNIPDAPEDLHTEALGYLTWLNRDEVKKLNNAILYGGNIDTYISELRDHPKYEDDGIENYISLIVPFVIKIESFLEDQEFQYNKYGFVVNSYGRKIYPKDKRNIFNNVIQSIGSEILIDVIIELNKILSNNKNVKMLFHRFDALFFDISKEELPENINIINSLMKSIANGFKLQTNISVGKNLTSMQGVT